jgi:hypothetical protein
MGAHDRGVDRVTLAVAFTRECLEEGRENSGLRPPREPRVDRRLWYRFGWLRIALASVPRRPEIRRRRLGLERVDRTGRTRREPLGQRRPEP